ncbi:unnamed protein product [Chrysoparadoxa australica]
MMRALLLLAAALGLLPAESFGFHMAASLPKNSRGRWGARSDKRYQTKGPSMVFEQMDPLSRSALKKRTYSTNPELLKDYEKLDTMRDWKDILVFSDKMDAFGDSPAEVTKYILPRLAVMVAAYFSFPTACQILGPIVHSTDSMMGDEVKAGLTGSFLPGISLLFGSLFSYTISLLVTRQQRIEELITQELSDLSFLLWHVQVFFSADPKNLEKSLRAIWRHTDQLIGQSRYQEMLTLVQSDPIEEVMRVVIGTTDEDLTGHSLRPNIDRDVLNYIRNLGQGLHRNRNKRLQAEGRLLPPVHFVILASLVGLLLFGFTLVSMQSNVGDEFSVAVPVESRILFALLLFSFSLLLDFALDLTNPFIGRYRVRKTVSTASLLKIRNEIVQVLGSDKMAKYDLELKRAKTQDLVRLRLSQFYPTSYILGVPMCISLIWPTIFHYPLLSFARESGVPLPKDPV